MSVTVAQYGARSTIAGPSEDAVRQCPYIPGFAISPTTGTWICSFGLTEGDTLTAHAAWPQRIKRSTNQGTSWSFVTDISINAYHLTTDGNVEWVSDWRGNGPAFVATFNVVAPYTPGTRSYQPGWAYTAYSVSYDDGLTWSPTARFDTLVGFQGPNANGNYYYADGDYYYLGAGPICELTDGTLLYATYNKTSTVWAGNFIYEVRVWRSTDHGTTWSQISVPFPHDAGNPSNSWEEPVLGELADGSVLCLARSTIGGIPCVSARKSTDGGATWGTATIPAVGGVSGQISASNRPNFGQAPGGLVLGIFRAHISPGWPSDRPVYATSDDGLTGWGSIIDVETNAAATNSISGGPASFHGRWRRIGPLNTAGNMALIYSVGATTGATYLRRFTVTGESPTAAGYGNTVSAGYDDGAVTVYEPPTASIVVDPASPAWNQIGTQIIVRVTADAPSSVAVTFTSADGSLVWFRGADADLFEVSLDGVTWHPRVDVPAGETGGFVRVTPAAPGTTLTAEIGISA